MIWRRITWIYRDLSHSAYIFPFTTVRRGSRAGPAPLKACVSPFIRAIIHFSFFFGGSFPPALSDCGAGIISWPSAGIFVFCIFFYCFPSFPRRPPPAAPAHASWLSACVTRPMNSRFILLTTVTLKCFTQNTHVPGICVYGWTVYRNNMLLIFCLHNG